MTEDRLAGRSNGRFSVRLSPWVGLAILSAAVASSQGDKSVMALLFEPMKVSLHFSDLQMGLLQGSSLGLAFLLASIPIGMLVDHANRLRLFFIGTILWSAGTLWTGFAVSFEHVFAARLLVGLGTVVVNPAGISLLSDWFEPQKRGLAIAVMTAAGPVGAAAGTAIGGLLFDHFTTAASQIEPWRWVHIVFGIAAFAVSFCLLIPREPHRLDALPIDRGLTRHAFRLWDYRAFLIPLIIGMTCSLGQFMILSTWTPAALERIHLLKPHQFSGWLGGVLLVSGIVGSLCGGSLSTRISGGGAPQLMRFASIGAILSVPLAAFVYVDSIPLLAVMLLALLLLNTMVRLLVTTALALAMPSNLRGIAMSVDTVISASIGLGAAPALVGWMSGTSHGGGSGLGVAMASLMAAAGLGSAICYWRSGTRNAAPTF